MGHMACQLAARRGTHRAVQGAAAGARGCTAGQLATLRGPLWSQSRTLPLAIANGGWVSSQREQANSRPKRSHPQCVRSNARVLQQLRIVDWGVRRAGWCKEAALTSAQARCPAASTARAPTAFACVLAHAFKLLACSSRSLARRWCTGQPPPPLTCGRRLLAPSCVPRIAVASTSTCGHSRWYDKTAV